TSSNNGADGTGILWASYAANGDANQSVRPGILRAFDAGNIATELWNNSQVPERDNAGNFAKFSSPTIANGHVYLPTFSNQVVVYGIVDSTTNANICPSVNLALNRPAYSSADENNTLGPANAFDGNTGSRWSSAFSDPQWIYVDLGQIDSVCRVNLSWEVALGKDFQIQVSDDAQQWKTVANITNNVSFLNYIDVSARGRYVRMYGTARGTPYGYSLYEFQVNGKVLTGCQPPSNLGTSAVTTGSVVLKWASTGAQKYNVQYATATSSQLTTVTTTADSIIVNNLGCAANYVWQVQSVCSDTSSSSYSSQNAFSTLPCPDCGILPTRITTNDIGNVGLTGQACFNGNTSYTLKGSGDDIYGNADEFRYVYKTFAGDGILQAKITSQDQSNAWNKAGLMFRATTDSTSKNVFTGITSGNGVTLQYRQATGAATTTIDKAGPVSPYFLRLTRLGEIYAAYTSPDSITWTQLAVTTNTLGSNGPIDGGLAVTSHDNKKLSTVQFDQVGFYFAGAADINIALNKPSYGSENDYPAHPWNLGNDGDTTTYWSSAKQSNQVTYEVDLGHPYLLRRLNILWGANYATDYTIEVSNDNVTWNPVQTMTGNTQRKNMMPLNITERFVRINTAASSGNNGYDIKEFQLFGDTVNYVKNDIAKDKPVTSSSDAAPNFAASKITDDNFTTRWASGGTDPQWVYVDLGRSYNITGVTITWDYNTARDFEVQTSTDAVNWTSVKSITGNISWFNDITLAGSGRYLRIYCTAKNGPANYSIYDLQVRGTTGTPGAAKYNISNFTVYPNPTKGPVSANFESTIAQDIEITVTDLKGNQLQSVKLAQLLGAYHFTTDLTHYAGGEYVISVKTAKGMVGRKVVKY
ncbi:MAG TPA: discoidin domain-containing protein, partial [Mucilaginibacter sp.]|nr:discoidin domain-containing protein [Mucilaginibacter sp.]